FESKASGPIVLSTWIHGLEANRAAWDVLIHGGKALDAVEQGVKVTEADITNRSVGIGGRPDRDGHVTLDACIMDHEGKCGAVGFLEGIKHPISVARAVMEKTQHVMLVGDGAKKFALDYGFETSKTPLPEVKKDWKTWRRENKEVFKKPEINHENHDTIGLIAMDQFGDLSGACTTSGWAYKMHGRIGDSPIIGAGLFVDNEIGACTASGLGEAIIRIAGSHTVVELIRHGFSPLEACKEAVNRIIKKNKDLTNLQCCFLAMDKKGNIGAYSVYAGFNYALKTTDDDRMVDAPFDRNW
ncbi:MAG: N(4)-(beta-N-acetylglucosaminyl)-L-asparaginase, partial [Bacteroidetes bacterium]|nr:N(4)-(beta-N-acetylglucosaminyl)-L-asparaginase [Bacteroidota bacterium]